MLCIDSTSIVPVISHARALIRLCLLFSVLASSRAQAQEDRALTSGLALGGGAGFENAGLGVHALYYVQTRDERWRVAPHIGAGYFGKGALSAGVMALFGRRHRLVLDSMVSPVGADGGTGQPTKVYYGLSLLIGYEWMGWNGVAIRTSAGLSYEFDAYSPYFVAINLLSVSYKFW